MRARAVLFALLLASGAAAQPRTVGSFEVVLMTDPLDATRNTSFLYAWESDEATVTLLVGCAGDRYTVGLFHPLDAFRDDLGDGELTLRFDGRRVLGPWPVKLETNRFTLADGVDPGEPLAWIRRSHEVEITVTRDGETVVRNRARLRRAGPALAALNCSPEAR